MSIYILLMVLWHKVATAWDFTTYYVSSIILKIIKLNAKRPESDTQWATFPRSGNKVQVFSPYLSSVLFILMII